MSREQQSLARLQHWVRMVDWERKYRESSRACDALTQRESQLKVPRKWRHREKRSSLVYVCIIYYA